MPFHLKVGGSSERRTPVQHKSLDSAPSDGLLKTMTRQRTPCSRGRSKHAESVMIAGFLCRQERLRPTFPILRTSLFSIIITAVLLFIVRPVIATDRPSGRNSTVGIPPLRFSVYATAGDVLQHLGQPASREQVAQRLESLQVSRLFLEGRRGDEWVPPSTLAQVRDFFASRGVECTGGIATVPGNSFGTRQVGPLGWLNWESAQTRRDVAGFFSENAPVFESLIVDDFYCTGDESERSVAAKGSRSWGEYRRDLLTGLIPELILTPARTARADVRMILKFPQWYDRFHLFGYDPARMIGPFDFIWVGTEVRNPLTRRMGFVQPTEGYINFRWLQSIGGSKVVGAWFDHIECTAQNFIDQAFLSVLAGAQELTLFHLGDLVQEHPGNAALGPRLSELRSLSAQVRSRPAHGIPYYKPVGSDPEDNMYLMDYLAMAGWPILPVSKFPSGAKSLVLGAPSASDAAIVEKLETALKSGATVTVTPAFLRAVGPPAARLAGVFASPASSPARTSHVAGDGRNPTITLTEPLDFEASLQVRGAKVILTASVDGNAVPLLTSHRAGKGRVQVLNVRTFSEQDFRDAGEWLLAPRSLGLSRIPAPVANRFRREALAALGMSFEAPAGVALHLFEGAAYFYNFLSSPVTVRWNRKAIDLPAHGGGWQALHR